MTQAQPADTLAGCVNQQINQAQPGNITSLRDHLRGRAASRGPGLPGSRVHDGVRLDAIDMRLLILPFD